MIVTCPACATQFVLRDDLVPLDGAPVQCSRCNELFTATLPSTTQAPGPLPRSDVMMFGSESYRSAEGRMTFGAPVVSAAEREQGLEPGIWPRPPSVPADELAAMFARAAADPDDDAGLTVLADSLMDRDDPQGQLMAFQLEAERGSENLSRSVRINVLLRNHEREWHPPGAGSGTFRRGLLTHVEW